MGAELAPPSMIVDESATVDAKMKPSSRRDEVLCIYVVGSVSSVW